MGSQPKGISASRGAAVLGLSEFQTPLEVFQRIMEEREPGWNAAHKYVLPPEPDNAAIRWGTAFEDAVVELAQRAQGKKIVGRERFFGYRLSHPGGRSISMPSCEITCHIDGHYAESVNQQKPPPLHEGKTTSAFTFREKWGEPGTDRIPRIFQVQVQHQMLCAGAEEAIVSVLVFPETPDKWEALGWQVRQSEGQWILRKYEDDGYSLRETDTIIWASVFAEMGYFHQYPVRANPEAQRLMVEAYREFWHKNVLTGTPPEPRNYEDVKRLFPEPKSTIVVPDYIERKIAEYKGIVEETANAKKRKERLKTIITKWAAEHRGEGVEDDESMEAVIFRSGSGAKLGQYARQKDGKLVFRC